MTARIRPLAPPYAPEIQKRLDAIMPPGVPPLILFTTLARNVRVFQRLMDGGLLDKGSITLRQREIVIDRTCARCGSEYEWGVHVAFFGERAGLTQVQIESLARGSGRDACWGADEAALVDAVDSLHDAQEIGDALWSRLKAHMSDEQIIEVIVLAGFYHTISFVTNALKLPLESYGAKL